MPLQGSRNALFFLFTGRGSRLSCNSNLMYSFRGRVSAEPPPVPTRCSCFRGGGPCNTKCASPSSKPGLEPGSLGGRRFPTNVVILLQCMNEITTLRRSIENRDGVEIDGRVTAPHCRGPGGSRPPTFPEINVPYRSILAEFRLGFWQTVCT